MKKTAKKIRRFESGGEIDDDRTSKDQDIGDDVRARARKFLETGKKDEEAETPKAKSSSKPKATAKESKPAPTTNKDVERLKESDKPLENVNPEDYLPGGGALSLLRKGASSLAKRAAKDITPSPKQITEGPKKLDYDRVVANRRSEEGVSPSEALSKRDAVNKAEANRRSNEGMSPSEALSRREAVSDAQKEAAAKRSGAAKEGIRAKSARTESSGAMSGDFKTSEIRKGFKAGGKVSSASSRGDGCAIRGKTRA
jgi:hypothetical protein